MTAAGPAPANSSFLPGMAWWLFSAIYFALALVSAWVKPGWYDEWFTIELARRSPQEIWAALSEAADNNPPLFYLIVKPFLMLGLPDAFAARLPSVLAVYAGLAGCYRVLRQAGSSGAALVGVLVPVMTLAFGYAYEARPYGVLIGATGIAFACWQSATRGSNLARIGLMLTLAIAVSCHYYALFAVTAFAVGELTRTVLQRRLDVKTWLAMGLGVAPLLAYWPLMSYQRAYAGLFGPPGLEFAQDTYKLLFGREILPLLGALALMALWPGRRATEGEVAEPSIPRHEVMAAVWLIGLPIVILVYAKVMGASAGQRYVIPTVLGAGLVAGWAVSLLSVAYPLSWRPIALMAGGGFLMLSASDFLKVRSEAKDLATAFQWVSAPEYGDDPIVTAEPLTYPMWRAYAPPELRTRLRYVPDPEALAAYEKNKKYSLDGAYLVLERHTGPYDVITLDKLIAGRRRVLIYGMPARGWVAGGLLGKGWKLTKVQGQGMHALYVAEQP